MLSSQLMALACVIHFVRGIQGVKHTGVEAFCSLAWKCLEHLRICPARSCTSPIAGIGCGFCGSFSMVYGSKEKQREGKGREGQKVVGFCLCLVVLCVS